MAVAVLVILPAAGEFPVKPSPSCRLHPRGTTDILARHITPGMIGRSQPVVSKTAGAGGTLAAAISPGCARRFTISRSSALLITAVTADRPATIGQDFRARGDPTPVMAHPGESDPREKKTRGPQKKRGGPPHPPPTAVGAKNLRNSSRRQHEAGEALLRLGRGRQLAHLSGERFKMAAGIKAQHVGFKGQSEFLIEIVAGRIHFGSSGLMVSLPFIRDGRLIALVVGTPQRSPLIPDVPAAPEVLPGWGREGSQAWFMPAGTPRAIRQQVSKELARQLTAPEVRERLNNMGFNVAATSPEEHEKNLRADLQVFSKLVVEAGLKPK